MSIGIKVTLKFFNLAGEPIDEIGRSNAKPWHFKQCSDSGHTAQKAIGVGHRSRRIGNWADSDGLRGDDPGQQLCCRLEAVTDFRRARRLAERRSTNDGDNSAHEGASLGRAGLDHGCSKVVGCGFGLRQGLRFHHDPHEGFGTAEPDEYPAPSTQ